MSTDRPAIIEALEHKGFTPSGALTILGRFTEETLQNSDHTAYRELADEVGKLIRSESDPDSWDGDDSELYLLTVFLEWLPDMIRHNDAEKLRSTASTDPLMSEELAEVVSRIAEDLDPFRLCYRDGCDQSPHWIRRSDGITVPSNVLGDKE